MGGAGWRWGFPPADSGGRRERSGVRLVSVIAVGPLGEYDHADVRVEQPLESKRIAMDTIDWVALGLAALHVLLALAVAVYVSVNRKLSSAIAWVMAVVFIPLLGILFFLLVGAGRLPKSRREAQRQVSDYILERTEGGVRPAVEQP
jgi:small-conductance mechanosensitive channel